MVDPNLFASGLGGFDRAYNTAYNRAQTSRDQMTRKKTGGLLASGDQAGAMAAAAEGGLLEDSRQISRDMQGQEQQQYERARQEKSDAQQQAERQGVALLQIAKGLQGVPPEARLDALHKMAPVLEHVGVGADWLGQVTPDQLSDQSLQILSGEIVKKIKLFNTSGGVVAVDEGALSKDINDPNASRVVYQDPLQPEYRQAQIGAMEARAGASRASANAANARARNAGGGRKGGSVTPSVPAGFVLD